MTSEKEKRYMPQSTAGLVRYYDVEEKGIKLKPIHVVAISVIFGLLVFVLKWLG
ncbi:MAG: preprotein translocase subunit Sec61beta [Candidatus Aenigmarchaeota archaeon]|nr:preprotein translocase subunit Sec61beta [Candidatus Aenigmarchaeota archaeon]